MDRTLWERQLEQLHQSEFKGAEKKGLYGKTNIDGVNFKIIHEIAKQLPVCKVRRPSWDVSVLMSLGMRDIRTDCIDCTPFRVLMSPGYMYLPMDFIVSAAAPSIAGQSVLDAEEALRENPNALDSDDRYIKQLKAMADANRMKILNALYVSNMSVMEISKVTGFSIAHTSYNLKVLKEAGIVSSYPRGKERVYQLSSKEIFAQYIRLRDAGTVSLVDERSRYCRLLLSNDAIAYISGHHSRLFLNETLIRRRLINTGRE